MPLATLHLLRLTKSTNVESFIQQLKQCPNTNLILASRPRHIVIHPTILDNDPLAQTPWDLLILLQDTSKKAPNSDPIPAKLRESITTEYKIITGIPSKLLNTYNQRDHALKKNATTVPLTGSLAKVLADGGKQTSQNLEISPELLEFMNSLSKTHQGPVSMLNLLHFRHPGGKQSYYQYGRAFVPVAGKRGGDAKLVGNVVPPPEGLNDSRGERDLAPQEWWNEISIVHYPSIRHFCDMLAGEDYQEINEQYRLGALRDTFLLCTTEFDVESLGNSKL